MRCVVDECSNLNLAEMCLCACPCEWTRVYRVVIIENSVQKRSFLGAVFVKVGGCA